MIIKEYPDELRYLGIDTPESTGQIEPYGKKASDFTKAIMNKATSVIIESDENLELPCFKTVKINSINKNKLVAKFSN